MRHYSSLTTTGLNASDKNGDSKTAQRIDRQEFPTGSKMSRLTKSGAMGPQPQLQDIKRFTREPVGLQNRRIGIQSAAR